MNDAIKQTATRVVDRLLGEDHASRGDFEQRPGGPKDPYRQSTMKMKFKKKDFTGKRGGLPAAKGKEEDKPKGRFNLKFGEARNAVGTPGKAWKKGKKTSGKAVAGKPGKVSYREALMAAVLEKLKMKKAGKGKVVAKKPGKVSYRKEDAGEGVGGGAANMGADALPPVPGEAGPEGGAENGPPNDNQAQGEEGWNQFWEDARTEASDPNDSDYLETLLYYLQLSDSGQFKGVTAQQLPQMLAQMSPEEWQQIGQQTPLRQQWLQQSDSQAASDEAGYMAAGERERAGRAAPAAPAMRRGYRRDQPPHVESMAKGGGMKGARAKKLLNAVAKGPGKVGFGKK